MLGCPLDLAACRHYDRYTYMDEKVADLSREGLTPRGIAAELGVNRSTVSRLLKYFPDSVNDLGFEAL